MDEEDRTTSIGLFLLAHTYTKSASLLRENHVKASHRDYPVRFLYTHAIELYLKAYLRMHDGFTAEKLRKIGHRMKKLCNKSVANGLKLDEAQRVDIGLLNNYMDDRYLVIGPRTVLKANAQHELCRHLHEQMVKQVFEFSGLTKTPIAFCD